MHSGALSEKDLGGTRAVLAEYDNMKKNHAANKRYDSFDELLSDKPEDA